MSEANRNKPHGKYAFDAATVRKIRKRAARGETQASLAEEYGVCPMTIHRLVNRKTYWYVK